MAFSQLSYTIPVVSQFQVDQALESLACVWSGRLPDCLHSDESNDKSNDTDDLPAYSQHEAVDTACAQLSKLFDQHAQLIHSLTARIN